MNEQDARAEEYRQMTDVFGRMAHEFSRIADAVELENKRKAAKKAKKAIEEKKEYYSLFTEEELALLRSAEEARASNDNIDIYGQKPGVVRVAKRAGHTLDLTGQSGTKRIGDVEGAEDSSGLRGNVTMQNEDLKRRSMGKIRAAVNREQEQIDRLRERESIKIGARALANKLQTKSWLELTAEELEQAKELFGDQLPEIIRLNEKKFTGLHR